MEKADCKVLVIDKKELGEPGLGGDTQDHRTVFITSEEKEKQKRCRLEGGQGGDLICGGRRGALGGSLW